MERVNFADLTGLRAVVTGSSSGIGRAIAAEFARGGAKVVVHCRRSLDAAEDLVEVIRRGGGDAALITNDLGDEEQLAGFVEQVWEPFQGVDVWVNNAGADLLTGDAPRSLGGIPCIRGHEGFQRGCCC